MVARLIGRGVRIGPVLMIGAGDGTALEAFAIAGTKRLLLLDPLAGDFVDGRPGWSVIPAALGEAEGEAEFREMSFAALSGITEPGAAMAEAFPGLVERARFDVRTRSLAGLLAELGPGSGEAPPILVVEAPEAADRAVEALVGNEPPAFGDIFLCAPAAALFEGSRQSGELTAAVEAAGFHVVARDESDAILPRIHLSQGREAGLPSAPESGAEAEVVARLEAETAKLVARNAALVQQADESRETAERARAETSGAQEVARRQANDREAAEKALAAAEARHRAETKAIGHRLEVAMAAQAAAEEVAAQLAEAFAGIEAQMRVLETVVQVRVPAKKGRKRDRREG